MKKILNLFILTAMISIAGCWDRPLLTELATNRLEVRLKGTYASNSPRPWFDVTGISVQDYNQYVLDKNSVDDMPYLNDQNFPAEFKFDLAEIRLEDDDGHVDRFAMKRQTHTFFMDETENLFNGTGVALTNDDPVPGRVYTKAKLYIRKMIFNEAKYYGLKDTPEDGWKSDSDYSDTSVYPNNNYLTVIFAEDETEMGFDFNPYQTGYLWDAYREERSDTNRIFPLEVPIVGGLTFDNKKDATVLEIRLVIKNFIKKYELDVLNYTPSFGDELTSPLIVHYFALSDWLRDVRAGETANGGNLHGVARSYVVGETGTITGTAPGTGYVIAFPSSAGTDITRYYIDRDGADSLRDRYVTNVGTYCDQPLIPSVPLRSIDALMDFYLKYENYRIKWDLFKTNCGETDGTMTNFKAAWNAYDGTSEDDGVDDGAARKFRIPPFAVYANVSETFTIENVPAGMYEVYFFEHDIDTNIASYATLFDETTSRTAGAVVTVIEGSAVDAGF